MSASKAREYRPVRSACIRYRLYGIGQKLVSLLGALVIT
jgi:hypothetical protein